MSRRKNIRNNNQREKSLSIDQIDKQISLLSTQRGMKLESMLYGDNAEDLLKANMIIQPNNNEQGNGKALMFPPDYELKSGKDFKMMPKSLNFSMMRSMGRTPTIFGVVATRKEQVQLYTKFTLDDSKAGWTIKKKLGKFEAKEGRYELTDADKKEIEFIVEFLENGGDNAKFDFASDFPEFVSKLTIDTLELDQIAFELQRKRNGKLHKFNAIDASTIRLMETIDVNSQERQKYEELAYKGTKYYPSFCQVYREEMLVNPQSNQPIIYYPWELGFGIRNNTSSIWTNGYGTSELEILTEIVTWLLWGMQYNGNFFKNGSNPKGFFTIDGSAGTNSLNNFRLAWKQMMQGVQNSHRVPIFEGNKINWVDMQHCLCGDTNVTVNGIGKINLKELFELNLSNIEVWDGKKFTKANIYKTQTKQVSELVLNNRVSIKSSPEHKFLTLRNNDAVWVERKDLTLDDYIFVNKNDKKIEGEEECLSNAAYRISKVKELIETEEFEQMYDIEMFNENHAFCANGIVVHNSNKDMEFANWNEFLTLVTCMVYRIAPDELGFNFKNQAQMFGNAGEAQNRIDHSKKKGLFPILSYLEKWINKYIVSELNEKYVFCFTGVDIEDIDKKIERDIKLSTAGFVCVEDKFEEYSGRKLDKEKDTILNQVYQSAKQAEAFGQQGNEQDQYGQEEDGAEQNPFESKGDPIQKALENFIQTLD